VQSTIRHRTREPGNQGRAMHKIWGSERLTAVPQTSGLNRSSQPKCLAVSLHARARRSVTLVTGMFGDFLLPGNPQGQAPRFDGSNARSFSSAVRKSSWIAILLTSTRSRRVC